MNKRRLRVLAIPILALLTALASSGAASAATSRPGTVASPAITFRTCSSSTAHWVHLRYQNPTIPDQCLGYTGTQDFGYVPIKGFCGGNNYGTMSGYVNGNYVTYSFHQGTTYRGFSGGAITLTSVTILGWYGNETCPL